MVSVGRHPNIELLTYSQVEAVSGFVGNFDVRVRKKARYVNEDLCTGCGTKDWHRIGPLDRPAERRLATEPGPPVRVPPRPKSRGWAPPAP